MAADLTANALTARNPADNEGPADEEGRWLRLDLTFDGTDFLGWQRQAAGRTVQGTVEDALTRILGEHHAIVGCGRTDAGTHARHLVASTRTRHPMSASQLARALDGVLPSDVGVLAVREAPAGFHARRDARWKWYRYRLLCAPLRRPLERRFVWQVRGPLDRAVLDMGAEALVGCHDFRSLANMGSPRRCTRRTLFAARWREEGDLLALDLVGDGFLYKMVRTIVGTLVQWAREVHSEGPGEEPRSGRRAARVRVGDVPGLVRRLLAARDRRAAGPAAPARGLYLMAVGVAGDPFEGRLPPFLRRDVESVARSSPGGTS